VSDKGCNRQHREAVQDFYRKCSSGLAIDAIAKLPDGFLTTHWMEGLPNPLPEPLADHSPIRYAQYIGKSM
jgi:hypothetical protein